MSALDPQDDAWRALAISNTLYRSCANGDFNVCNWLIEDASTEKYCVCCRHNRTIPDISIQGNLMAWRKVEAAKHRLFYTLLQLRLPLNNDDVPADQRLIFDFLAAPSRENAPKILTGHENGVITLALEEADDVERERRRSTMHESYLTLLGHFRHEV